MRPQTINCSKATHCLLLFPCGAWISVFCLDVDFPLHFGKVTWNLNITCLIRNIIFQNLHFLRFKMLIFRTLNILYTTVFFSPRCFTNWANAKTINPDYCLKTTSENVGVPAVKFSSAVIFSALPDLICHHLWIQPSVWNDGRWTVWCGAWRMRVMRPIYIQMLHVWYSIFTYIWLICMVNDGK